MRHDSHGDEKVYQRSAYLLWPGAALVRVIMAHCHCRLRHIHRVAFALAAVVAAHAGHAPMQVLVDHPGMELGAMPAGQASAIGVRVSSQTSKTKRVSWGPPSNHQVLTVATSSAISSIVHWMLVGQG